MTTNRGRVLILSLRESYAIWGRSWNDAAIMLGPCDGCLQSRFSAWRH